MQNEAFKELILVDAIIGNKIEMELIALAAIISGDAFEQAFHCCQFFSKKHC